ncbi:MAG: hypothetical protein GXO75_07930 [Calditrichaeota bacterium]|nr:hypothetical protein [Calditrichota bacterium]
MICKNKLTRLISFLIFISSAIFISCDTINIFDSNSNHDKNIFQPTDDQEFLTVNISGGFAGVKESIHIFADGQAILKTQYAEKRTLLSQKEINNIAAAFIANHFFTLKPKYIKGVMDAFFYDIYFTDGQRENRVRTDAFNSPANLGILIEEIQQIKERILNDGIKFELTLDKTQLAENDSVQITLTMSNTTDRPIELTFSSSQLFDIIVYDKPGSNQRNIVWNWAHNLGFLMVITKHTLASDEPLSETLVWRGQDNEGKRVHGTFYITGKFMSPRGGETQAVQIKVD